MKQPADPFTLVFPLSCECKTKTRIRKRLSNGEKLFVQTGRQGILYYIITVSAFTCHGKLSVRPIFHENPFSIALSPLAGTSGDRLFHTVCTDHHRCIPVYRNLIRPFGEIALPFEFPRFEFPRFVFPQCSKHPSPVMKRELERKCKGIHRKGKNCPVIPALKRRICKQHPLSLSCLFLFLCQ